MTAGSEPAPAVEAPAPLAPGGGRGLGRNRGRCYRRRRFAASATGSRFGAGCRFGARYVVLRHHFARGRCRRNGCNFLGGGQAHRGARTQAIDIARESSRVLAKQRDDGLVDSAAPTGAHPARYAQGGVAGTHAVGTAGSPFGTAGGSAAGSRCGDCRRRGTSGHFGGHQRQSYRCGSSLGRGLAVDRRVQQERVFAQQPATIPARVHHEGDEGLADAVAGAKPEDGFAVGALPHLHRQRRGKAGPLQPEPREFFTRSDAGAQRGKLVRRRSENGNFRRKRLIEGGHMADFAQPECESGPGEQRERQP